METAAYVHDSNGKLLARQVPGQGMQYYVSNGHGDITEIRDAQVNVLNRYTYDSAAYRSSYGRLPDGQQSTVFGRQFIWAMPRYPKSVRLRCQHIRYIRSRQSNEHCNVAGAANRRLYQGASKKSFSYR